VLAPEGQFAQLVYPARRSADDLPAFVGAVGGVLHISGSRQATPLISGQLVLSGPGQESTLRIKPQAKGEPGKPSLLLLDELKVLIQPRTLVRYAPVDLQAEVSGELTISGQPGQLSGDNALTVCGELDIPAGSMYLALFKHEIRLSGEQNHLQFSCTPGDLMPYFSGTGQLVLPDAIKAANCCLPAACPRAAWRRLAKRRT